MDIPRPFGIHAQLDDADVTMLRQVLERYCKENTIDIKGPQAEKTAAELIDWFIFGVTRPDDLFEMIRTLDRDP